MSDDDSAGEPSGSLDPSTFGTETQLDGAGGGRAEQPDADAIPPRGSNLGRYVVLDHLGSGGMGVVLRAYDPKLHREVAVKRLRPGALSEEAQARLMREAQAMARLSHPNVIPVYDIDRTEVGVVLVMEFVEGQTLKAWVREQARPWRDVMTHYLAAGRGLAAAHDAGLVHRDFKPTNVQLGNDGRARVMDFGLVCAEDPSTDRLTWSRPSGPSGPVMHTPDDIDEPSGSLDAPLTQVGVVVGTPAYMAPEQHTGETADARSDQYAFCVSLWEGLVGKRPFRGALHQLVIAKYDGPPAHPKVAGVPRRIFDVIARGMWAEPGDRWPSMHALLDALSRDPSRRRRSWVLAVGGLAGVAAGVTAWSVTRPDPCPTDRDALDGVWDDEVHDRVGLTLAKVDRPWALDVAQRTGQRLDAYAQQWLAMEHDTCEATHVRHEQSTALLDLRRGCLQSRQRALSALVAVLETADADVAERAVTMAEGLPRVQRCGETEALLAAVPPPEDADDARRVDEARDELARIEAETAAGRHEAASDGLDTLMPVAETLGYAPLMARVYLARGNLLAERSQYDEGEAMLLRGYETAVEAGDDRAAARAATALVDVVGNHQARIDAARTWSTTALALAAREDPQGPLEAAAVNVAGVLEYRRGRYASAGEHFTRAADISRGVSGPDSPSVATALNHLGAVLDEQERYAEAEDNFRKAIDIFRRALGEQHPRVSNAVDNLALCLNMQGRTREAEALHREVLELRVASLGEHHSDTAMARNNLGWALHGRGDVAAAAEQFRLALETFERVFGPDHHRVAMAAEGLALMRGRQERFDEAQGLHERALAIRQAAFGEAHPNVAASHSGLGDVAAKRGDFEAALVHYEAGLQVLAKVDAGAERFLGDLEIATGRTLLELGRPGQARVHLERAVAVVERGTANPGRLARASTLLADALCRSGGDAARAEGLIARAKAALETLPPEAADDPNLREARRSVSQWSCESPSDDAALSGDAPSAP